MAVLFGRMRSISRGAGSSAVTAAAYRSCSQLTRIITDKETGFKSDTTYDYSNKKGLVFSRIFAPEIILSDGIKVDIPEWIFDRQSLWQRIEDIETRVNSELAKEYVVALPKEFTEEQNIELLQEFIETSFVSRGMVVDVNYHADNPENPHAHIMFPMRSLELNEQGEVDFGGKERAWKSFALLNQIKQEQRIIINNHYAKNGFEYDLQWGPADGLESTFHHGGIKNLWRRNQEILERNASRIIADPSLVIDKLDHNKAVFTSDDIETELEKALQLNIRHLKSKEYIEHKEFLDIYLKTEKLKMLDTILLSDKLTLINPCDFKGRSLFAKTKQVELEKRFIAHIEELNSRNDHVINIEDDDIAPLGETKDGKIIEFTDKQKQVIKKTLAGKDISIIEGWPGAGKSTVTKEIVRHYKERGYEIIAAAPTNKAAQELENKLGVKAYTAAALRMQWQLERGFETGISLKSDYYEEEAYKNIGQSTSKVMDNKTVLIIDEISMIDTPTFDYFAGEVVRSGSKIIGLGDNNQNQAIGMKGAASKAIDIAGSYLLTEINRHKNLDIEIRDAHIEASTALSNYQIPKALSIYEQLGAINVHAEEDLKEQAISNTYIKRLFNIAEEKNIDLTQSLGLGRAASKIAVIAYTNAEIDRLNAMIRASLKRSGILANKGESFLSGGIHGKGEMVELCSGDRIIFKSNQKEDENGNGGVMNNEIGTVRKVISSSSSGKGSFLVDIERDGEVRTVAIRTGEEGRAISFRHAYAITSYAVQGSSIDHILLSIDKHSGYEVTLVGLTRHKQSCELFAALDTLENEVYRTKDLDVDKVREEYKAISYKWTKATNEESNKEEVPLWKLGLGLLVSKHSNLNFALDYNYNSYKDGNISKGHRIKLSAIYREINQLREELDKHNTEIYKFEQQANYIEILAGEHFELVAGDVIFDARSVMKAPLQYMQINSDEASEDNHIAALKAGILRNGERKKINWKDLDELDQNLVLHSYLDHENREKLSRHLVEVDNIEQQIKQISYEHIGVFDELKDSSQLLHSSLNGNWAAIRDYCEAKKNVQKYQQEKLEIKIIFRSAKIQKLLIREIKEKYGVKFRVLDTNINFIKNSALDNNIDQIRQDFLLKIAREKNWDVIRKNKTLFVFDILKQTKNTILSETWHKANIIDSELEEALRLRETTAKFLIEHYHTGVAKDYEGIENRKEIAPLESRALTVLEPESGYEVPSLISKNPPSIRKLFSQLNFNYQTVSKHARISDERHYFKKLAEGSVIAEEHYGKIMQLVEKAELKDLTEIEVKNLLKSHYELSVISETINKYLAELKLQKSELNNRKKEHIKLLEQYKFFKATEFSSYIGHIYKTNHLEVIDNLDKLLEKSSNKKQLILSISESPEMLGELKDRKERGIIEKIFSTKQDINVKLDILGENIERYLEGYEQIKEIQSKIDGGYFNKQLEEIDLEITKLKIQAPSAKETKLLTEISKIQSDHMIRIDEGEANNIDSAFVISISDLLRENDSLDLLFNWKIYQSRINYQKAKEQVVEFVKGNAKNKGYNNLLASQSFFESEQLAQSEDRNKIKPKWRVVNDGSEYNLQWSPADGLELIRRNQEILERNASRIIVDPSLVIDKLDHNKAVFTSDDIEAELEKALQLNIRHLKSKEYIEHKESLDIYLKTEKLKMLDTILLSDKLTLINPCDLKGRSLFAKTKQVELEKRFIAHIEELNSRNDHVVHVEDDYIAPLYKTKDGKVVDFTDKQKQVIKKTLAGKDISIIEGWPGAGKSTVTKEIVRHYKERGYEIIAAAPTNKAAQELENKLGVKAYTAASLRMKWQLERGFETSISLKSDYYKEEAYKNIGQSTSKVMDNKTVLIIDEISMIDTPTFDYFAGEVVRSGSKIIGLGDNNQNQAIGMKGAASKAIDIAGSYLLTEINRHKNLDTEIRKAHIEASTALSNYQISKALSIYEQLEAINLHENEYAKEEAIFNSYMEKLFNIAEEENIDLTQSLGLGRAASKIAVIAYTNAEIDRLNVMIRASLKRSDILANKGESFLSGGIHGKGEMVELCAGDRIIFKSNQKEDENGYGGVMNNEIGTVRKVISSSSSGKGSFLVDIERDGEVRTVAIRTGEEGRAISFRHAYAITSYAVQGSSIDHILLSIDKHSGYEVTLVGLTRHKQSCELFAALDTLENEVYRTKDLDVDKVREEYKAISYKWTEATNEEGNICYEKEDIPLWKLGLTLLASKRSNLNFSLDYRYGDQKTGNISQADRERLSDIYWDIGLLRDKLEQHNDELYKFELQVNSPLILLEYHSDEAGGYDKGNEYYEEDSKTEERNYTQMELFALQHFELVAGDIIFDTRAVMKAPLQYMQINSDEASEDNHIAALKAGILKNGEREKINWKDLDELDQNLVLHSYLDHENREKLSRHLVEVDNIEQQIKQISSKNVSIFKELQNSSKPDKLNGNWAAIRDYLESRAGVRKCYKEYKKMESVLVSSKIQKLLLAEIKAEYGVKFRVLDAKIRPLKEANKELKKIKNKEDKKPRNKLEKNNPDYKTIEEYRKNFLLEIAKQKDWDLIKENKRLFVFDILQHTKNPELLKAWDQAQNADRELEKAMDTRAATAGVLIGNYHRGVPIGYAGLKNDNPKAKEEDGEEGREQNETSKSTSLIVIEHEVPSLMSKPPSISKLLAQLNLNYYTIAKHARIADERHYFDKIIKGSAKADEHYGQIMKLIEKAKFKDLTIDDGKALLKSHYELAISTELINEYLTELKSQKTWFNNKQDKDIDFANRYSFFKTTEFNSYIGHIYETNRLEVIKTLDGLLEKSSDRKQLILSISESPEMLGELKDKELSKGVYKGLLAKMFKSGQAMQAEAKLSIFGKNLQRYLEGYEQMSEIQSRMDGEYFKEKLEAINLEIAKLESQIPNSEETELLTEISRVQSEHMIGVDPDQASSNYHEIDHTTSYIAGNKLDGLAFTASISDLLRQDKSLDLLFNWKIYQGKIHQALAKQKEEDAAKEEKKLDFNMVDQSLTSTNYESIFRTYLNVIKPDTKIIKRGNNQGGESLSCGSFSMNLENGFWNRFSRNEGGNIFGFVAYATGKNKKEALEIVADMVGIKAGIQSDTPHQTKAEQIEDIKNRLELKEEWSVVSEISQDVDPFSVEQHLRYMLKDNELMAVYEYRNIDNQLLGYTVRFAEKTTDNETGKKQVLPVTYCYNESEDKYAWRLKGFNDKDNIYEPEYASDKYESIQEKIYKPIYGAEKIRSELKPVLIVEGEKACDAAQKLLPEYIVISWLGGSKAVDKVNWQVLTGREVVIWPDNDQPGIEAANNIQQHIDRQNGHVGLCNIVDVASLNLPEKWDLADKLPDQMNIDNVRDSISNALSKYNVKYNVKYNIRANHNLSNNNLSIEFTDNKLGAEGESSMISKIRDYTFSQLDKLGLEKLELEQADKYVERLESELKVIEHTGFARDFILAHQTCNFARNHDIAIGPGRGSAVGSLTAYLLGIHAVDPIKYDLSFERFLTINSNIQPDFDIDIAASKKEIAEDYLFSKYPEAAKLEVLSKDGKTGDDQTKTHPAGIIFIDEQVKNSVEKTIENAHDIKINHMWVNNNYFARASLDKYQVEKLGIRKLDLLSSKVLDEIKMVEDHLEQNNQKIDWEKINWHDQHVFEKLSRGNLGGVYQFGSDYAKKIIEQVGIKSFEDMVAMQALIRPGAKNIIEQYKANNAASITKSLPELKATRGVILYQEQIMKLAENYLGIEADETNKFRKDLAKLAANKLDDRKMNDNKKDNLHDLVYKPNFIKAALDNGKIEKSKTSHLYDQMLSASKYCFNKSHATAYAMLSFKTAYIATHHKELRKEIECKSIKQIKANKNQLRHQVQHSKAKLSANSLKEYVELLSKGIERVRHYRSDVSEQQNKEYNKLIDGIKDASKFLQGKVGKSEEQLLKTYKLHATPEAIHKVLLRDCRQHNYKIMQQELNKIDHGKKAILGGKEFDCKKAYLERLHEHSQNSDKREFWPVKEIKASLNQIKQHELELHKQHEMGWGI